MKKYTKHLCLLLAMLTVISLFAACGNQSSAESSTPVSSQEATEISEQAEAPVTPELSAEEPVSAAEEPEPLVEGPVAGDKDFDWSQYEPLTEDQTTLTMFYTQPPPLAAIMDTPNDKSYLYQTFEKITNVHIDFQMVSMMDASTTFQLMIASGEYCDIINDALNYYDTPDQAYEDGLAVDLLEYADCVPHFLDWMEEYPEIKTDLLTLDGRILNMPRIDIPLGQTADSGFLIRKDWLDELGLDVPQNYDAMHDVLTAFKDAYQISDPYVMPYQVLSPWGLMAGGYGISVVAESNNFYVDLETDEIKLSTISDAYYDYLSMFRDWYSEGLISSDFISYQMNLPDESLISTEQAGIWFSDLSYIKTYQDLLASVNSDAELALMGDPGIDDEKTGYIADVTTAAGSGGFSVSESCNDIELALRWCDIWYDPSLTQFINYGYEGETFEYDESGTPILGGCIVNNDLGLPSLKMANGVFLCTSGGFIYDIHKYDLEYTDLQLDAYTTWLNAAADESTVKTSGIPGGAKLTVDEATTVANVMSDITTHVAEMALKFVTGVTELNQENYDKYVSDVEEMRLQDALDAMQSAYNRYLEQQ